GLAAVVAATRAQEGAALLGLGALAVVIGTLVVAPVLARAVIGVPAAPVVAGIRPLGRLARGNVLRNPRRTTSTAGALMIGMALVGAASVLAASTQASVSRIVGEEAAADLIVQSVTASLPTGAVSGVRDVDGAERVDVLSGGYVTVGDERIMVAGFPADGLGTSLTPPVVDGTAEALAAGQLAVQRPAAEAHGWALGDVIEVRAPGGDRAMRIGAVLDSRAL